LRQDLEHDHVGPPVEILFGAEEAVFALVVQSPVDPLAGFGDEFGIVEEIGERDEAVEIVGAALPTLALATQPGAVGGEVGPEFVNVAGQSVALDLELLEQPTGGLDSAEGERVERVGGKWRAIRGLSGKREGGKDEAGYDSVTHGFIIAVVVRAGRRYRVSN